MPDSLIKNLTDYTPPLDADALPIVDIANDTTKKVTWANIKAAIASATQTFTNKRVTKRVYSTTTTNTLTPEISTYDEFALTAQAANLTIANHSTSTPADGDKILITITPDATPRTLTFGDKYVAKAGVALPTTTTASKTMVMGFRWDAGLSQWNLLALGTQA